MDIKRRYNSMDKTKLAACIIICFDSVVFAMCIVVGIEMLNSDHSHIVKILYIGAIVAVYRMAFTDAVKYIVNEIQERK
jgi:arginine exporter protein ArgO